MHDDSHAVGRLVRSPDSGLTRDAQADILKYRILGGWSAFVIDMNERVGLPFPDIDFEPNSITR